MTFLALTVREPPKREGIGTVEEPHAVLERETYSGVEFPGDVFQPGRVNSAQHHLLV
jgi:hypothetical protein